MNRGICVLAALLVTAGGGHASLIEDNTPIVYQNDGGEPGEARGDAPDRCPQSTTDVGPEVPRGEGPANGQLVPVDDPVDFWRLEVDSDEANDPITVTVVGQPLFESPAGHVAIALKVEVRGPGCEDIATDIDEDGILTFIPGDAGTFRVRVADGGLDLGLGLPYPGPSTQNSHCAPFCANGYEISAT